MACNINFSKFYGEHGQGFIHVHHVKSLSETGITIVNPKTDLIVLCTNGHAMVHRKKDNVLTLNELKSIIIH